MLSLLATIGEIQNVDQAQAKLLNDVSIQALLYVIIAYCHIGSELEQLYADD